MKIFLALALTTLATYSFADSVETICLSSAAKEHKAAYTVFKLDLPSQGEAKEGIRIEYSYEGKKLSEKKIELVSEEVLTNAKGEKQYSLMDEDAEFYLCSAKDGK